MMKREYIQGTPGKKKEGDRRSFVPLLCLLLVAGCSSPLEIDTARDRIVEEPAVTAARLPLKAVRFRYDDGSSGGVLFDEEGWRGEIDTATGRLWLEGGWTIPTPLRSGSGIPLMRLALAFDSVAADGTDFAIINGTGNGSGSLTVNIPPIPNDQEMFPDGASTTLTLRPLLDRTGRQVGADVAMVFPSVRGAVSITGRLEVEY